MIKAANFPATPPTPRGLSLILWPIILLCQLLIALLISWHLLAQYDFAFPLAYDALNIDQHIQRFGPQNHYRPDFASTDQAQHRQLFSQIAAAIQHSGKGLAEIEYHTPSQQSYSLLRQPEVIHLQDVANLIDFFYVSTAIAGVLLAAACLIAWRFNMKMPPFRSIAIGILLLVGLIALILGLGDAEKVFYWLHEQVFPDGHQWFFYYQESLMTTLMKAPDLFGFIGLIWALGGLLLWLMTIFLLRWLLGTFGRSNRRALR